MKKIESLFNLFFPAPEDSKDEGKMPGWQMAVILILYLIENIIL